MTSGIKRLTEEEIQDIYQFTGRVFKCREVNANRLISQHPENCFTVGNEYREVVKSVGQTDERFIRLINNENVGAYTEAHCFDLME